MSSSCSGVRLSFSWKEPLFSTCFIHLSNKEVAMSYSRQISHLRLPARYRPTSCCLNLQKPILDLVDEGRIEFSPTVELSYLTKLEQAELWDIMQSEDCTPSLSQAVLMEKLSKIVRLTPEIFFDIMSEKKQIRNNVIKMSVSAFVL